MVSLASGSDSLKVWKFDNENLNLLSNFGTPTGSCICLAWNHTNQVVASGGADNRIYLIQANNGQVLSSLQVAEENSGKFNANAVAFSNNSRFLAAALDNHLQFWDLKRRQMKSVMTDHHGQISACCFLPTGDIISGDVTGAVRIWDAKAFLSSPELIATNTPVGVTSLSISPTSSAHLAAGYSDGFLGVWDTATYKLIRRQQCHRGSLNAVAYSPRNPRLVATGGSDYRVALVDTGSRNSADPSAAIEITDRTNITSVTFHEDAIHTAIGLGNGNIVIYDWRKIKQPVLNITAHEYGPVHALAFQVPKANKSSDASGTSGTSVSTSATAATAPKAAAAPAAGSSIPKMLHDSPSKEPSSSSTLPPANTNSNGSSAPPAVANPRASLDSTASQRSSSEAGSKSPETSSLRRLHNVTSPSAAANLPPPPPAATATAPSSAGIARQAPTSAHNAADKSVRSAVAPQQPPQAPTQLNGHSYNSAHASSLPVPQQLEVSFDRSVDAVSSVNRSRKPENNGSAVPSTGHAFPEAPADGSAQKARRTHTDAEYHRHHHSHHNATAHEGHAQTQASSAASAEEAEPYAGLRQALKPVTVHDLEESLQLLRYDIHREVQDVVREQIRQFSIAKDDTAELLKELSAQMADLLKANQELRAENEYLRRIY